MAENAWELVVNDTTYLYEVSPLLATVLPDFPGYDDLPAASYPATIAALYERMVTVDQLPDFTGTDAGARALAAEAKDAATSAVATAESAEATADAALAAAGTAVSAAAAADAKAVLAQTTANTANTKATTNETALATLTQTVAGLPSGGGGGSFFASGLAKEGVIAVQTKLRPLGILVPPAGTKLAEFRAAVATAPVGADLIVQLTANDVVIATCTIGAGKTVGRWLGSVTVNAGARLNFNVTQVGSTTPGSDLELTLSQVAYPVGVVDTLGLINYWDVSAQGATDGAPLPTLSDSFGSFNISKLASKSGPIYRASGFGAGKPALEFSAAGNGYIDAATGRYGGLAELFVMLAFQTPAATPSADEVLIARLNGFYVGVNQNKTLKMLVSSSGTSWAVIQNTASLVTTGVPHVLALLVGGGRAKLLLDKGTLLDVAFSAATTIGSNTNALGVGAYGTGGSNPFTGLLGSKIFVANKLPDTDTLNARWTELGAAVGLTL